MDILSDADSTTLHGVAEVIALVPYQIGYHPTASLVAVCVQRTPSSSSSMPSARGVVVMTARVDLVPPVEHALTLAALEPALLRTETDMVILISFEEGPGPTLDGTELLAAVAERARSYGVSVVGCARVRGRRWRPLDAGSHTDAWLDLPASADVRAVADYVLAGRAPARDRRAVEALLRPARHDLAEAVARGCAEQAPDVPPDKGEGQDPRGRAARTLASLLTEPSVPDGRVDDLDAAELVCAIEALDSLAFRDAVLSVLVPWCNLGTYGADTEEGRIVASVIRKPLAVDRAACLRMTQAAAYAPAGRSAPWLSLVGFLAWQAGEGALANVVIGAARAEDPTYSLARLVDLALCAAVAPPRPV
ncbi:MAG: DUF4192 domain-containing protein [Ornithinimicrobium sp.]